MSKLLVAVAISMIVSVSASAAVAQQTAGYDISGVHFTVPIPDGYCLPQGSDVEMARRAAEADDRNVTNLSLYPCRPTNGPFVDYILVKTPVSAVGLTATREQLLAGMGAAFDSGPLARALASGEMLADTSDRASASFGYRLDLAGEVRPLGRDSVCAYIGGTVSVTSPSGAYRISGGSCLTVVAGRVVGIHVYGPDEGTDGVLRLLRRSRRFAESIRGNLAR